jgi:hypothetical protein
MTLHIPKAVLFAALLMLAAAAGVLTTLVVVNHGGDRAAAVVVTTPRIAASVRRGKPAAHRARPQTPVRLVVRATPDRTSEPALMVRGRTTRGATVTIRGQHATVQRGSYHAQLRLRMGTNRFTVVARHAGRRTRRRHLRIDRVTAPPPAPAQWAPADGGDPCAPGNGHGDNNPPGSYIEPSLGYCVPANGIEPEG